MSLTKAQIQQLAGYVMTRNTGPTLEDGTRGFVTVYEAEAQGFAVEDGGKFAVVCEEHGSLIQGTKKLCLELMRAGSSEFCDCCRKVCGSEWCKCPQCGRGGEKKAADTFSEGD